MTYYQAKMYSNHKSTRDCAFVFFTRTALLQNRKKYLQVYGMNKHNFFNILVKVENVVWHATSHSPIAVQLAWDLVTVMTVYEVIVYDHSHQIGCVSSNNIFVLICRFFPLKWASNASHTITKPLFLFCIFYFFNFSSVCQLTV